MKLRNILYLILFILFYSCDLITDIISLSINSKEEWLEVKADLDKDWNNYMNKTLDSKDAAKKFIEYADAISTSKVIPPQIRYEESIALYREALKFVENEKVAKKLRHLEEMYKVVNLE